MVIAGVGCKVSAPSQDSDVQQQDTEKQVRPEPPDPDEHIPPEAREFMRTATVETALEMMAEPRDDHEPRASSVIPRVYERSDEAGRGRLENAAAQLARSSESPLVRKRSIWFLSVFGNKQFDLRAQIARADADDDVRLATTGTLGRDGAQAMPVLRELTADANSDIRQAAQDALTGLLAKLGDEGIRALVRELGVYKNDASALAAIGLVVRGEEALPYLVEAAMGDESPYRRAAATSCIAMICSSNNPYLDAFAARAQATLHDDAIVISREANLAGLEPLMYVLENDSYGPAREIAAQGLGYLGSARAVPALASALSDPHSAVRRRAAAALETLPAEGAVKQLANVVAEDKVAEVRAVAVRALGNVGNDAAIVALARATGDRSSEVREAAADELGRLQAVGAFDALVRMFDDPDDDVRWAAVRAVGNLRTDHAVPYLVDALRDPVPQVVNAAERGLQQLGIAKRRPTGFREPSP